MRRRPGGAMGERVNARPGRRAMQTKEPRAAKIAARPPIAQPMPWTRWIVVVALVVGHFVPAVALADDAQAAAARASLERIRELRAAARRRPAGLLRSPDPCRDGPARCGRSPRFGTARDGASAWCRPGPRLRHGVGPLRAFSAVRRRLLDDEPATREAPVVLRLGDPRLFPKASPTKPAQVHYVGSIAQRKIVGGRRARPGGRLHRRGGRTATPCWGWRSTPRDRLYAVSTNGSSWRRGAAPQRGRLLGPGDSGRLVERVEVPEAMQLNDLAFGRDGSLYVTDSAAGALWRLRPAGTALRARRRRPVACPAPTAWPSRPTAASTSRCPTGIAPGGAGDRPADASAATRQRGHGRHRRAVLARRRPGRACRT